jgi:allantoin racemase
MAETVLVGAVMAGVPRRLQGDVPVPLIDGLACGVRQAELLVRLALPKARTGSYAPQTGRELVGVTPAIARTFAATPSGNDSARPW